MQPLFEKSLTVAIVDDEERACDALRLLLQKFVPQVNNVAVCTDARQASSVIAAHQPQLLFLDIRMPHLSGFDVLNSLPQHPFKVIFTTAFDEFAIKAIRFSAFDYLLKPVDAEELVATVNRFLQEREAEAAQQALLLENMRHNLHEASADFRLAIPAKDGVIFLQPSAILYLEGVSNYTRFYTEDGKQYLTAKTLGDYEDLLAPYRFLRCHKSYIVNKGFITTVDNAGRLVLRNGASVEISKRRKAEVMKVLRS